MSGEPVLVDPQWMEVASDRSIELWVLAFLFYGVGDTVTTFVGLRMEGVAEVGPLALIAMEIAGNVGFVAMKGLFMVVCFGAWYVLDTRGRVAIPLALIVAGGAITFWNLLMLAM